MAGSGDPNNAAYWWTYEYDLVGNLSKQTDAKGQPIEFGYDELNRMVRKYYAMDWVSSATYWVAKPSVYDIMELRNAVNANRLAAGLAEYYWSDPSLVAGKDVRVRARHFTELRTAIEELWSSVSKPNFPSGFSGG